MSLFKIRIPTTNSSEISAADDFVSMVSQAFGRGTTINTFEEWHLDWEGLSINRFVRTYDTCVAWASDKILWLQLNTPVNAEILENL